MPYDYFSSLDGQEMNKHNCKGSEGKVVLMEYLDFS